MSKNIILFLVAVLFVSFKLNGQTPLPIERKSNIKIDLKRSSKRSFSLVLEANDVISLESQAEGSVNLIISDPNGQVVYQGIAKSQLISWQKTITVGGSYTVELESVALLLSTRVSLSISVLRTEFSYGHPSMDSLVSKRTRKTLVDGEFEITRKTPKTYTYSVVKGDTLIFSLKPLSNHSPTIEIQNDLNELVFASFSAKKEQYVEIPILQTGAYSVTMNSEAYLHKKNYLKVEVLSPARYAEIPDKPASASEGAPEVPEVLYDTIPEIFMDTVLFLGAQRDIINASKKKLEFKFENPSSIIKWLVIYGAGKEFLDAEESYSSLLVGDVLAAGATNILAAYGLGFLKKLPDQGNKQIKFTPSPAIKSKLRPPIRNNYATIESGYGSHWLTMENTSQSSGMNVYVRVVVFRKLKIED